MSARRRQIITVVAFVLTILVLDQASKAWVRASVPEHDALLKGNHEQFFQITYEQNKGLVNSAFQNIRWVVIAAPLVATAFLLYLFRHLDPRSWIQTTAFSLVLGGALGNMIDRVYWGFVTDFIQIHFYFVPFNFPWKYWPPFNIADSCICVGVVLLAFTLYGVNHDDQTALEKPEQA